MGRCTEGDSSPGGAFGVAQSMGATQNATARNKANKTKGRSFILLVSDLSLYYVSNYLLCSVSDRKEDEMAY
jgi:hypothetical protein